MLCWVVELQEYAMEEILQELDAVIICSKLFKCTQDVKLQLIIEASSLNTPLLHATISMCSWKISMFIVELEFNLPPTNP